MRTPLLAAAVACALGCASVRNHEAGTAPVSGSLDVGGAEMYYEATGEGPPVLFLHAGIADCRMWDGQVSVLSREYRVVRCDLRGFGRTPRGTRRFAHHQDVATLLDELGIERVHVVGASFGGRVAVDFALAYPHRVLSLVLCSPAISGMPSTPELDAIDSTEETLLKRGDMGDAAEFEIGTWVVGPSRRSDDVPESIRESVKAMLLNHYSHSSPDSAQSIPLEPRAMTRLEDISVPTLIIVGDRDVSSFRELSLKAAQRIPHARRLVVAGVAHLINMEKPEEFNHIVAQFLGQ